MNWTIYLSRSTIPILYASSFWLSSSKPLFTYSYAQQFEFFIFCNYENWKFDQDLLKCRSQWTIKRCFKMNVRFDLNWHTISYKICDIKTMVWYKCCIKYLIDFLLLTDFLTKTYKVIINYKLAWNMLSFHHLIIVLLIIEYVCLWKTTWQNVIYWQHATDDNEKSM